jgi:hypothetical protein
MDVALAVQFLDRISSSDGPHFFNKISQYRRRPKNGHSDIDRSYSYAFLRRAAVPGATLGEKERIGWRTSVGLPISKEAIRNEA